MKLPAELFLFCILPLCQRFLNSQASALKPRAEKVTLKEVRGR